MTRSTMNSDGPECPYCGHVITPDGPEFYDERAYTGEECPKCERKFNVEVITSVDWHCSPIEAKEEDRSNADSE